MLCDEFTSAEAYRIGLVQEVVPAGQQSADSSTDDPSGRRCVRGGGVDPAGGTSLVPRPVRLPGMVHDMHGPVSGSRVGAGGHAAMLGPGDGASAPPDWAAASTYLVGLLLWLTMVVAMMLPAAIPLVRYRGLRESACSPATVDRLPVHRVRPGLAALGFVVAVRPLLTVPGNAAPSVAAAVVASASRLELTPFKARALRRCHRTLPVRFTGRAADVWSVSARGDERARVCAGVRPGDGCSRGGRAPTRADSDRGRGDVGAGGPCSRRALARLRWLESASASPYLAVLGT